MTRAGQCITPLSQQSGRSKAYILALRLEDGVSVRGLLRAAKTLPDALWTSLMRDSLLVFVLSAVKPLVLRWAR